MQTRSSFIITNWEAPSLCTQESICSVLSFARFRNMTSIITPELIISKLILIKSSFDRIIESQGLEGIQRDRLVQPSC